MKSLFLLRHAKAASGIPGGSDFDRPLNDSGRAAAELIGQLIIDRKLEFDLVVSSPAVRARETTEVVLKSAHLQIDPQYDSQVYEAGPMRLLEVISEIEPLINRLLLVGHNPGFSELLQLLTANEQELSTATIAKIDLEISDWQGVEAGIGKLDWVVRARDLE